MDLLVYRFSALGDVILTVPAIQGTLSANPDLNITFVSDKRYAPFFNDIDRCTFCGIDPEKYLGVTGLYRLFNLLRNKANWVAVIDLHNVLRSRLLNFFFKLARKRVFVLDKQRNAKLSLIRRHSKGRSPLPHIGRQYLSVFEEASFRGTLESGDMIHESVSGAQAVIEFLSANGITKDKSWIGISPYTTSKQKEWPERKIYELLRLLESSGKYHIFLLGGGSKESTKLRALASSFRNTVSLGGVIGLEDEIALMHQLDAVVSMDSFNMHLAALCNVPVVSIWGGTHKNTGFGPLNNFEHLIVEISLEELPCRPCSVFGSKPCFREDWACLERITAEMVFSKVQEAVELRTKIK